MTDEGAGAGRFDPGDEFGPFHVVRVLGSGGMGEVYLVTRSHIDRVDALKVLKPQSDAATTTRFLREMRLASRLQHPHVVAVHDIGEVRTPEGAQPWILMQYVAGSSLRQVMDSAAPLPLPVARTLRLLTQVADGLEAAHRLGIVHRDVKPENVLVHHDPSGREHAYVVDLGIAEALDAESRLTGTGRGGLGTPGYISPERYYGSLELDVRADVYGLACMAFEMLTTKLPRDVAAGFTALPSLDRARPGSGADADAVMRKGLALLPAERYESCPDFVAALTEALPPAVDADKVPSGPQTVVISPTTGPAAPGPVIGPPQPAPASESPRAQADHARAVPAWSSAVAAVLLFASVTIAVRQDLWRGGGPAAATVEITTPEPGDVVTSPCIVEGTAALSEGERLYLLLRGRNGDPTFYVTTDSAIAVDPGDRWQSQLTFGTGPADEGSTYDVYAVVAPTDGVIDDSIGKRPAGQYSVRLQEIPPDSRVVAETSRVVLGDFRPGVTPRPCGA